jgi:hypothetical protein
VVQLNKIPLGNFEFSHRDYSAGWFDLWHEICHLIEYANDAPRKPTRAARIPMPDDEAPADVVPGSPDFSQVTVRVHRYEGGAFVTEQLKAANARADVSCKEVEDSNRGTVIKRDSGFFVFCGYALATSRLPSQNIIEIYSYADSEESRTVEDNIYGQFIATVKGNPEVDSIECLVGKRFECWKLRGVRGLGEAVAIGPSFRTVSAKEGIWMTTEDPPKDDLPALGPFMLGFAWRAPAAMALAYPVAGTLFAIYGLFSFRHNGPTVDSLREHPLNVVLWIAFWAADFTLSKGFVPRNEAGVGQPQNMYPWIVPTAFVLLFIFYGGWRWFRSKGHSSSSIQG